MSKLSNATILRIAKGRIERLGWCQGDENACHGDRHGGPRCAATAFVGVVGVNHPIYDLFKLANGITTSIGVWNDAPERTLEEVLAAYDRAIAAADLKITADELRAMPMPKAVVAFLRACRTFEPVGDIDGPWSTEAGRLLDQAYGYAPGTTLDEKIAWDRRHTEAEVFAMYDKAIAAAEEVARGHQE